MHIRFSISFSTLLVLLVLLSSSQVFAQGETVNVAFDWSTAKNSSSTYQKTKIRSQAGKEIARTEANGSFKTTIVKVDEGFRLDFADMSMDISHTPEQANEMLQSAVQRLSSIRPSYIISNEGQLLKVSQLDEYQKILRSELDNMFSEVPEDDAKKPEFKELMAKMNGLFDQMLSEEALFASMQQSWNRDVAQWIGFEAEVGYIYEVEYTTPVPMLGNAEIDTNGVYEFLGSTDCKSNAGEGMAGSDNSAASENDCVELKFSSVLDPESTVQVIEQVFKAVGQEMPADFTMKLDYETYVVTEPDTLIPHSSLEIKTIVASAADGSPPVTQIEEAHVRFNY